MISDLYCCKGKDHPYQLDIQLREFKICCNECIVFSKLWCTTERNKGQTYTLHSWSLNERSFLKLHILLGLNDLEGLENQRYSLSIHIHFHFVQSRYLFSVSVAA